MNFYKKDSNQVRLATGNSFISHIGTIYAGIPKTLNFKTNKSFLLSVTNDYNHGSLFFVEVSEFERVNIKIVEIYKDSNLIIKIISNSSIELRFTNNHGEIYYIPLEF